MDARNTEPREQYVYVGSADSAVSGSHLHCFVHTQMLPGLTPDQVCTGCAQCIYGAARSADIAERGDAVVVFNIVGEPARIDGERTAARIWPVFVSPSVERSQKTVLHDPRTLMREMLRDRGQVERATPLVVSAVMNGPEPVEAYTRFFAADDASTLRRMLDRMASCVDATPFAETSYYAYKGE